MPYLKKINFENIKNFLYLSRIELLKIYNKNNLDKEQIVLILHYYNTFVDLYDILCAPDNVDKIRINKQYLIHYAYNEILKCIEEIKWEFRLKIWPIKI